MWVQYKHKVNGRLRKYQFSQGDPIPYVFDVGDDTWLLNSPEHMKLVEVVPVPDVVNPDMNNVENMKLIGIAELIKDDITGLKLWATYNNEGGQHINLSPSQPMIIPAEGKLQLGTKIGIYVPKD